MRLCYCKHTPAVSEEPRVSGLLVQLNSCSQLRYQEEAQRVLAQKAVGRNQIMQTFPVMVFLTIL